MIEYGQLINYNVLKILMNVLYPWINFLYNPDILNDLCNFFNEFSRPLGIF